MKKVRFQIIAIMLAAIICVCLTACGANGDKKGLVKTGSYDKTKYKNGSISSGIVAQNDRFSIEWNDQNKRVVFNDLKNGVSYSTAPKQITQGSQVDENGLPIKNNPRIESAISVTYYDELSASEQALYSYNAAVKNGKIYVSAIENGIRVIYDFTEKKISVPVDYTIDDKSFKISVITSEISDGDEYTVTGVSIAPFICGIKNDPTDDSYLFLPDGSGAIIRPKTTDTVGIYGSIPVYGGDYAKRVEEFRGFAEPCYMPVYGMKNGDSGLCAIIDSSAERAFIEYSVGSSNIGYSSVYPFFRIKSYTMIDSPLKKVSENLMQFNEYLTDEPLSVSYYPLFGEDCGYNAMADIYRGYLVENYGLKKLKSEAIRLSLEIEGGIENKKFFCGVPYTGLTPLTDVKQAKEIAEYFSQSCDGLMMRLCGFTQNGLDVGRVGGGFRINSKLGGKKDIAALADYCKDKNIVLSLDFDPISFNEGGNGYSIIKSAAKFSDEQTGYIDEYNNVTGAPSGTRIYLLSRALVPQVLSRFSEKSSDYGFEAVGLGKFGSYIYSDFSSNKTYNCNNIQESVVKGIKSVSLDKSVVLTGANDYAVAVSDYISGVPVNSSGYDFYSCDVPFYTMVFKGYASMSSKAVNLAADSDKLLLSCVEAGISPSYAILYDFTQEAILSKYAVTRSSEFMHIREDIVENFNRTRAFLEAVSLAQITEHRVIDSELRAVTYDNGVTVYINYGNRDAVSDGVKIPAKDYTVIGG